MRKDLSLMGAATDLGQAKAGTEIAPSWLRYKGSTEVLTRKFFNVADIGDINPALTDASDKDIATIAAYNHRLKEVALGELNKGRTVLTLGGDHSIAIGTLAASLIHKPHTKVVWVDAHADINTFETSPSGNVHGMPLAFFFDLIQNREAKELFNWVPSLDIKNLVYIGLRDVDHGEREFIKELGITSFYAEDVMDQGIDSVLEKTLQQLCPHGNEDVHLSFDVDGLDPKYVPATGTPVPGGLHLMDGQKIINTLMRKTNLISFDLVEVNPLLGTGPSDLELTSESIKALLESIPSWNDKTQTLDKIILSPDRFLQI